ncbi:MAG TPA: vitamin K epoxide reductase family protein [Candidatus Dormibacteraeota bacterium]|nr:vitamin K epoxide reductase family protein [Candidatus Dormibacteraeota bacterium]
MAAVAGAARRERSAATLVALAVPGIAIAVYLTAVHYAAVAPVCAATGSVIDCGAVTRSAWSVVPGTSVPVTIPGLLWFVVSGGLAVVALRAAHLGAAEPSWLRTAQAAWAGAGVVAVLYFVYAELVALHRICEWCTAVHLLVLASFLVALVRVLPAGEDVEGEAPEGA